MQSTAPGQNRTGAAVTPDQIDRTFEAVDLFKDAERRDPAELLGNGKLPKFIQFKSHRDFVRETIARETQLRKDGTEFVPGRGGGSIVDRLSEAVIAAGSLSSTVADTYSWTPGTELMRADVKAA